MNASSGSCTNNDMNARIKHDRVKTVSPLKVWMGTHVCKPKVTPDKAKTKEMRKCQCSC